MIGVTSYAFPELSGAFADVWLPVTTHPYFVEGSKLLTDTASGSVKVYARLAPGITRAMAAQELLQLVNELRKQHPKEIWDGEYIRVYPGGYENNFNPQMYEAAAVVGVLTLLILAVACANLGGLLMARGVAREHELSIRIAIGASRKRIFRQLFTESFLLAMFGSVAGMALAYVALRIILVTSDAPAWATPDWRVLCFVFSMALITALFFGLAPALQLARQTRRRTGARQILVAAQVAASCVLIIIASLLVRAVQHALYTNPGFGYEQVTSVSPNLDDHNYKPAAAQAYMQQLEERVHALPGVTSVALVKLPPLGHGVTRMDTELNGHPLVIFPNWIDSGYFRTMEIPLLSGRNFEPGEKNVVIVSKSMAQVVWPGQNPLGQQYGDKNKDTVIGVVGNARVNDLREDDTVELYWPVRSEEIAGFSLVLKTSGAPDGLAPQLKAIVQNLDPRLFPEVSLLKSNFRHEMKAIELAALTVSFIGVMAIILAGVGLLGLVAFTISQRSKEIAIRLALGASRAKIIAIVLSQFSWPVLIGLAVGVVGTAAASQILRRVLYGVSNLDPISYASAVTLLIAIIVCAALLPTRKALSLDVAQALHQE